MAQPIAPACAHAPSAAWPAPTQRTHRPTAHLEEGVPQLRLGRAVGRQAGLHRQGGRAGGAARGGAERGVDDVWRSISSRHTTGPAPAGSIPAFEELSCIPDARHAMHATCSGRTAPLPLGSFTPSALHRR